MGNCPQRQPSNIRRHCQLSELDGKVIPVPFSRGRSCAQLCPTLWDPVDSSPPVSSVQGISQARILEWVAILFSRGSSWTRDRTCISCIGRWIFFFFFLITEPPGTPKTGMLLHILQCTHRPAPRTKNYLYQNFNNVATAVSWIRWIVLVFNLQSVADIKRNNTLTTWRLK